MAFTQWQAKRVDGVVLVTAPNGVVTPIRGKRAQLPYAIVMTDGMGRLVVEYMTSKPDVRRWYGCPAFTVQVA